MVVKDVVVVAAAATTIAALAGITVFVSEVVLFCKRLLVNNFLWHVLCNCLFLPAATATGVAAQSSGRCVKVEVAVLGPPVPNSSYG